MVFVFKMWSAIRVETSLCATPSCHADGKRVVTGNAVSRFTVYCYKLFSTTSVQNCSDWLLESRVPWGKLVAQKGTSMTPQPRDWRELAEKASKEMDPEKLELLIDELNCTLDRDERRRRQDAA